MELTITEKEENRFLSRVEVKGTLRYEGATPNNAKVVQALAHELKCEADLVVIKHIYSKFSYQEANFQAVVYKNAQAKAKGEVAKKQKKKDGEAENAENK